MKVKDILNHLEQWAPPALQESYDNARLIVGNTNEECKGVLVSLDCVEDVVEEAIETGCNLIVSHHPILFGGIKSLNGKNYVERTLLKAIQNNIALYAIHTNLDNVDTGVNAKIGALLGLKNLKILLPKKGLLSKLVVFGVAQDIKAMGEAIFQAGGGQIGTYSECGFKTGGLGSFKPDNGSNPTLGDIGVRTEQSEERLEVVVPNHLISNCLAAARGASSYEELAYDIIPLGNVLQDMGSGMIGDLPKEEKLEDFLLRVKDQFKCGAIKYAGTTENNAVKKVAFCGGSGFPFLGAAKQQGADIYITSDVKYHQFFDAEKDLVLADIGHYESEQFTTELIGDFLKRKFPTFAVRLTSKNTNPVNYI